MDLSVQQPVFQPSTPTTNGHKAPEPAPKAPSAARRPRGKVIVAAGLLVAGLAGFGEAGHERDDGIGDDARRGR